MMMDATYPGRAEETPKAMRWTGYALTGLSTAFMLFDSIIKIPPLQVVTDTMAQLGYLAHLARPIGVIELVLIVLYVFPRTAVLAAILLTAVMGGAIASHMRLGDPLFSHTLFGVYLGAMIWGGVWFRDARLRSLVPFRR